MHERDLRRVGGAAEHALTEEGAAQSDAVETADQHLVLPTFDAVGMAAPVKLQVQPADRRVYPGVLASRRRGCAGVEHRRKGCVRTHDERLVSDGPAKPGRYVEGVQRNDATLVGLDEEDAGVVAGLSHGKDALRVATQEGVGGERPRGRIGGGGRVGQIPSPLGGEGGPEGLG